MSEKSEKTVGEDNRLELIKWSIVVVIVAAGVYANSIFAAESLLIRTIGLLAAAGAAGWVGIQTQKGRAFVNLCLEARIEIRKVVWPTRQETVTQTITVLIVIFLVALILWLLDWGLNGVVSSIIG
ncbi:MAG: preprotein translocase subunit SecE [Gammaproteobacteria bacterium]|nr:preprotein translocase subunit SecE [Gammaproteobacteria bacterium]